MASKGCDLNVQGRALLLEDLQSPCTEDVAVFHAFSRVVNEAHSAFVVLDTAPTGHSLLLMDATGAYHRQMTREFEGSANAKHIITPLMRLQDANMTRVIIVTGTADPLLKARLEGERRQLDRIANGLAHPTFVLPWLPESPVGLDALGALTRSVSQNRA